MKKCFTLFAVMLITVALWAQNNDYLLKKDFQSEKKKMSEGIDAAKKIGFDAKKIATKQMTTFDSLSKLIAANEKDVKQANDSMQKMSAQFKNLDLKINKTSSTAQSYLLLAVIVIAILFLLLLAFIFFLKSKADEKVLELSEENIKLDESVKQDLAAIREEFKKSTEALSLSMHEYSANFSASIERCEEKQQSFAAELKELVDKAVKQNELNISKIDEKFNDLVSKLTAEQKEHKASHDKLESDLKGIKSLHIKDIEELKARR
ncbi:MAG: hypothetical protein ABSD71_02445 [Bacteroidales bacterium]|jgi:uncharacterized coiled-coil protein SlyX